MVDKKTIYFWILAFIAVVGMLTAINWFFIPGWQSTPGGIWKILGNSIGYTATFFFGLITILNILGLLGGEKNNVSTSNFLHQLPELDKDFFGRIQQLQLLKETYASRKVNVFGIVGMGGIGKTMLALAFAKSFVTNKYDAEIFLDMRGIEVNPISSEDAMLHVVRSFNPSFNQTENISLIIGAYRSVFHGRKVLIFFDNVKDEEQIKNLLPPKTSLMIFTSRQRFVIPDCFTFLVPLMSRLESQQFLLKIARRLTTDDANRISELCGYLPNALSKAGKILREYSNLNVPEYIKKLSDAKSRIDLIEPTTDVSYNLLSNQLKKIWRKLSVFPEGFGMEAAEKILGLDFEKCEQMLLELNRVSMLSAYRTSRPSINQDQTEFEIRFKLHDLDRVFANSKLKLEEKQDVHLRFAEYYSYVLNFAGKLYRKGGANTLLALNIFDIEWVNIEYGQYISSLYHNKNDTFANLCVVFSLNAAELLDLRVSKKKIVEWSKVALQISRRKKDLNNEGVALNNLGTAYSDMGEFDTATPLLLRALEISEETKNKYLQFARLANLGNLFRRKGDLKLSLNYHDRAYKMAVELKNQNDQIYELVNIGNVYFDMGEKEKALEKHLTAHREAVLLEDKWMEMKALLNLARDYEGLGSKILALKHYRASLLITRVLGAREVEAEVTKLYKNFLKSIGLQILEKVFLR